MTPAPDRLDLIAEDVARLTALVRHLTAVVVTSPMTDDEDKRELMRLAYPPEVTE